MFCKLISTGAFFQYAKMTQVGVAKDMLFFIYPKVLIVKSIVFVRSSDYLKKNRNEDNKGCGPIRIRR